MKSPMLSSMTKNLTLRGDWSLTFAHLGQGRDQPFSWAGGPQPGLWSCRLWVLVFRPPFLDALPILLS